MFEKVATNLPLFICDEFRSALKSGHWSNGEKLTEKQRLTCINALFFNEHNIKTRH